MVLNIFEEESKESSKENDGNENNHFNIKVLGLFRASIHNILLESLVNNNFHSTLYQSIANSKNHSCHQKFNQIRKAIY